VAQCFCGELHGDCNLVVGGAGLDKLDKFFDKAEVFKAETLAIGLVMV
jgi:hypothetical protein